MKKELLNSDKELLLKDLCARLPYGVMCATTDNDGSLPNIWEIVKSDMLNEDFFLIHDLYEASRTVDVKEVRPYLFPLSSMTEEQVYYIYEHYTDTSVYEFDEFYKKVLRGKDDINILFTSCSFLIDYLNKNHFDYRGLIEKGLSIDCTNLDIY